LGLSPTPTKTPTPTTTPTQKIIKDFLNKIL